MKPIHPITFTILALSFVSLLQAADSTIPAPSEQKLAKSLGGANVLEAIRGAERIKAVRLHERKPFGKRAESKFVETGRRFDLSPEQAATVRTLLGDRHTYIEGSSACMFDPGIKLIVHYGAQPPLEWSLCLKCADVQVDRGGESVGFASFLNGHGKVLALATVIFPKDEDISRFVAERQATAKQNSTDTERWRAAMPKPLRRFWTDEMATGFPVSDVKPLRRALAKGMPDVRARILALLTWFGSGAGPWTGFPGYEDVAEKMLLDFPTAEIVAAIESAEITEAQTEGSARFFGGWTFSKERPEDLKKVPTALKKVLLQHTLKSLNRDNRNYAKQAFR